MIGRIGLGGFEGSLSSDEGFRTDRKGSQFSRSFIGGWRELEDK